MNRTTPFLAALSVLALTAPALAQDTSQTTGQTAPEASSVLDMGQPEGDGPRPGERYSKEKFGDWDLACIKVEADTDPCSMVQLLKDNRGNDMAEFSLFRLEGQGVAVAGASVIVPLETLLPAQLTIAIDGASGKRYNYSFCNQIGCVAQIGLTQEDIDAFKKGGKAAIRLVPAQAPDQVVELEMSLKGFTAAFDVVDIVTE